MERVVVLAVVFLTAPWPQIEAGAQSRVPVPQALVGTKQVTSAGRSETPHGTVVSPTSPTVDLDQRRYRHDPQGGLVEDIKYSGVPLKIRGREDFRLGVCEGGGCTARMAQHTSRRSVFAEKTNKEDLGSAARDACLASATYLLVWLDATGQTVRGISSPFVFQSGPKCVARP